MAKKFSDPEFEEFDDFEEETFVDEELNLPESEHYTENFDEDDDGFSDDAVDDDDLDDDYEVSIRPKGRSARGSDEDDWSDY